MLECFGRFVVVVECVLCEEADDDMLTRDVLLLEAEADITVFRYSEEQRS